VAGVVDVGYGRAAGSGWGQRSLEWLGLRLELEGDGGEDGESVVRAIVMLAGRLDMGCWVLGAGECLHFRSRLS
jgi:hypothetical protein